MEHPNLSDPEKLIIEHVRKTFRTMSETLPREKRGALMLALVVELAEEIQRLAAEHDTERPPAPEPPDNAPCGIKVRRGGHVLHCRLVLGHEGPCRHD